jgi:ribosomal protein S12 methylthiotransferase accessory factor
VWRARHGTGRVVPRGDAVPTPHAPAAPGVVDLAHAAPADAGRDGALARAADAYRATVPPDVARYEFPIHALDRIGVPVFYAVAVTDDGAFLSGVGYGESEALARTSALGEMAETAGAWTTSARSRAARRVTRRSCARACPRSIRAGAACRSTPPDARRPLQWVEARRWPDGATQWCRSSTRRRTSATRARRLAVHADHQRHGRRRHARARARPRRARARAARRELARLPRARPGRRARPRRGDRPGVARAARRARPAGIAVVAKLAATSFGMANVYVVGAEREPARAPHPIMLTACGEAAHPDRERALRKALLEFCSSRVRKRFAHGALADVAPLLPPAYREALCAAPPGWDEEGRALGAMRALMARGPDGVMAMLADRVLAVRTRLPFAGLPTVPPGTLDDPPRCSTPPSRASGRRGSTCGTSTSPRPARRRGWSRCSSRRSRSRG